MDWVITLPKKVSWELYKKELEVVEDDSGVLNYHVRFFPKEMKIGDRCFLVWNGAIRGWMKIVGLLEKESFWNCSTTGELFPPGKYLQRSGKFHYIDGISMKGFRGIRKLIYYENNNSKGKNSRDD